MPATETRPDQTRAIINQKANVHICIHSTCHAVPQSPVKKETGTKRKPERRKRESKDFFFFFFLVWNLQDSKVIQNFNEILFPVWSKLD